MIKFVNAKLNIGLGITRRREDGYHDLETIFYPVGVYNGTPENSTPFCDVLQVVKCDSELASRFRFSGNAIDCPPEKNLVCKAVTLFESWCKNRNISIIPVEVSLEKHLPDGAGLGGGSADASFVLKSLNEIYGNLFTIAELQNMALQLGADCPFFIENRPVFASGVGELFDPVPLNLSGWWAVIAKPNVYVSTREAFAGITPSPAKFNLRHIAELPVQEWREVVHNDFENSIFPLYPELKNIKDKFYSLRAVYASMSGSGSSLYGLFAGQAEAAEAAESLRRKFPLAVYLCKL